MAYGDEDIDNGLIPPNSVLRFEVEVIDFWHDKNKFKRMLEPLNQKLQKI